MIFLNAVSKTNLCKSPFSKVINTITKRMRLTVLSLIYIFIFLTLPVFFSTINELIDIQRFSSSQLGNKVGWV